LKRDLVTLPLDPPLPEALIRANVQHEQQLTKVAA